MGRQLERPAFGVCAVGFKGAEYLDRLIKADCAPEAVFCYRQAEDFAGDFDRIAGLCRAGAIRFAETKAPEFDNDKPLFFVGWQYLVKELRDNFIVLHDSLLPKYRGFAPTVNCLIKGETRLGVTAFRPREATDSGPIIGQLETPISYPIRIEQALRVQAGLMANLTMDILSRYQLGSLVAVEQNPAAATFSIWRNEQDYKIDWNQSSAEIRRMVDAVSFPYAGATTELDGETLVVDAVSEVEDLNFELRHPGKIWRIDQGKPIVVCGRGLLRLDKVVTRRGENYAFERLRVRLS